jgi:hypothetical protein
MRQVNGFSCQLPGIRPPPDPRAPCPAGLSAAPIYRPFAGSIFTGLNFFPTHERNACARLALPADSSPQKPFRDFTNGIAMQRLTGNMKKYCVVTGT